MQVDCYKRNYNTEVCSSKCMFRDECDRAYKRELHNYNRNIKARSYDNTDIKSECSQR